MHGVRRIAFLALALCLSSLHAQNIFDCPSGNWSSQTGGPVASNCGVSPVGNQPSNWALAGSTNAVISAASILMQPTGTGHAVIPLIYQTPVNVHAFTANFEFIPNGQFITFFLNNNNNPNVDGGASHLIGGAGAESGIFQGFGTLPPSPNKLWAIQFDSYDPIISTGSFTYSSVQMYQQNQTPGNPPAGSDIPEFVTNKISTSPVPLNSPAGTLNTSTGDTYSATITYDGSTVTLNLFDVTAGGSCPGASCFTTTWTNVSIPSLVAGDTAYVGITTATGINSSYPLTIVSTSYTVQTPTALPGSAAPTGGAAVAANPTFSPGAGTYSGTQSVTISCSTPNSNICYSLGASGLVMTPIPNNIGGCGVGTAYSSPVTISSSQTLYASCGTTYTGLPSGVTQGAYTISATTGATPTATPTFSPVAGTYTSAQSVSISDATSGASVYYTTNGTTPTTSSTRYTGAITVSSTETLKAMAVASGDTDSAVASADYTMSSSSEPVVATPTFSPAAGTYTSAQSVSISDATSGATIYYTTNGSTPTTSSTKYTGPIAVGSTETLEVIAVASGDTNSAIASATYTISSSSGSGSANPETVINYPDGFSGSPSTIEPINDASYSGSAIQLTSLAGNQASNVYFKTPVNVQAFTTTFTWTAQCPSGGIRCGDGMGFMIISTTNPKSPAYWSGGSGASLSWASGCTSSSTDCERINSILVKFDLYNVTTGSGTSNLTGLYASGEYPQPPNTEYDMAPSGINIQSGHLMRAELTYNGTTLYETVTDTVTNATYTNSYTVNIPSQVGGDTALVGFSGGSGAAAVQQNIESWTYTVQSPGTSAATTSSSESVVSTPTFSPAVGTYSSAQSVTLSDATSGATIYYTTNGTTPTTSSTKYTGPVTVSSTETLQAIAIASDHTNSGVASAVYTIAPRSTGTETVVDFPSGFSDSPSTIEPIDAAFYSGPSIQLTSLKEYEAGNVYFKTPVNVQAFTTTFTWTEKCLGGGINCGDGMGFMIIGTTNPKSPSYWSGGTGSNLSWSDGCTGSGTDCEHINSILVKFTLNNPITGSYTANLTGLYSEGEWPQPPNPQYDMAPSGINMQSGHLMKATLTYNGTTLYETVTDTVTNNTYTHHYTVNIPVLVRGDTAIVGFAGATGTSYVQQNIDSWTYTVQ
jgi:Chitobiase/beta-hexosaminidase C-terminal domain/Legume lectin domain